MRLSGPDDEDRAHRRIQCGRAAFAGVACVGSQHVVELRDLQLGVADHGIVDLVAADIFNILRPLAVAFHGVDARDR